MKVKILSATLNPFITMAIAAKTCYSSESPIDIVPKNSVEFVRKVLTSGHLSIAEHVYITFAIEGISRAASHQLVRHRHCTFSQQSQRYVDMQDFEVEVPNNLEDEAYIEIDKVLQVTQEVYKNLVDMGVKKEDARCILPNCTSTNIVMSTNLHQLIHIANLRLCTRAQSEIRELFKLIKDEIANNYDKDIAYLLQPQCEMLGYCPEHNSCGRKKMK